MNRMRNRKIIKFLQGSIDIFDGLVSVEFVFYFVQFGLVIVREWLEIRLSLLQMFYKIFQFSFYFVAQFVGGILELFQ